MLCSHAVPLATSADVAQVSVYDESNWAGLAADFLQAETLEQKEYIVSCLHGITGSYLRQKTCPTAGTVLQHCKQRIHSFLRTIGAGLCVFKIGYTSNPLIRLQSYAIANFSAMELLHVTNTKGVAEMLEAALIDHFKAVTGCRNDKPGGEGPGHVQASHYYVYIVGARADQAKRIGG